MTWKQPRGSRSHRIYKLYRQRVKAGRLKCCGGPACGHDHAPDCPLTLCLEECAEVIDQEMFDEKGGA